MGDVTLYCETCGYDLIGTARDGRCPECGRAVAESLPQHREGTAWQRSPGLFSWALTCKRVLVGPTREFGRMSLARGCTGMLAVNLFLAGALIVAPWTGVLIGDPARSAHSGVAMLASFAAQAAVVGMVLYLLTLVSTMSVLAMARGREWRLARRGAWNVACHASVGWLLAGLMPLFFLAIWYTVGTLMRVPVPGSLPGNPGGMHISWQSVLGAGAPVLGFACGAAVFGVRLLGGARVCRFAVDPRRWEMREKKNPPAGAGGFSVRQTETL